MRTEQDAQRICQFRRHEHLAHKGEVQDKVYKLQEGWASRYCVLPDGRRQITALFLPGDYCEPQWLLSGKSDLPIVALTPVKAQTVPLAGIHAKPGDGVMKLLRGVLEAHDRQTSWIVSLGRKSAIERVTDLLAELFQRMRSHKQIVENCCTMPLTQQDIADVVGLTPVHVNRVLGDLRSRGLVRFSGKTLHLPKPEALGIPSLSQAEAAPGRDPAADRRILAA
ncbi:Crp/Fnr family transcriptional regulator [Novosphingobium panipatense]|uniref:cAMP-binding domain of CRP or a regulatory subunit of cAMP-dependent protein kinases n=2 Tax=Novosphingobium panipatense TaxID=428991 RepID=A0ABY1QXE0_9SPHN|nr:MULTISPECIES: Crp/Fnr family transcriptional regulator [Novosphingobium]SMP82849.1 cAMP-binding domain of CRP or a regulatory subunit of cAMP-dependent protein kinases [Novosphingobium panipatense]